MSSDRLFPFIGYLTALSIWYVVRRVRLERQLRHRRAVYDASTRPEELEKRLDALVKVAAGVLDSDVLRRPEIEDPTLGAQDDQERLEEVITLCASRYGLDRSAIFASYARLPAGVAADVRGERQLGARLGSNDPIVLERAKLPSRWRVRVATRTRETDASVAYQEERDYVFAVRMRAGVRRMGYLHARSIEHLRRRRAELVSTEQRSPDRTV